MLLICPLTGGNQVRRSQKIQDGKLDAEHEGTVLLRPLDLRGRWPKQLNRSFLLPLFLTILSRCHFRVLFKREAKGISLTLGVIVSPDQRRTAISWFGSPFEGEIHSIQGGALKKLRPVG